MECDLVGFAEQADQDALATRHEALSETLLALIDRRDVSAAVRLACALHRYWFDRAHHAEACLLLERLLAVPGVAAEPQYPLLTVVRARFAFFTGDPAAGRLFTAAAAACRAAEDRVSEVEAVVGLARVALRDHRFADVRGHAGNALELARGLGDRCRERPPLHMLAAAARMTGEYAEARRLYLRCVELAVECGSPASATIEHHNLGYVALRSGDLEEAEAWWRRALAETQTLGLAMLGPYLILSFAVLAAARGDLSRAATLAAAADARFEALGIALDPDDAAEREALERRLAGLDRGAREESTRTGRSLGDEDAVALLTAS